MNDETSEPNPNTPQNQEPKVMESALIAVENLDKRTRNVDLDEGSTLGGRTYDG